MINPEGISVSELNLMIAEAIRKEPRIRNVTVRGEVSGFKHHIPSGHWYFMLKDEDSAINCVMFRQNTLRAALRPKDGQSVVITGYIDVYPKNGTYQLYAMALREDGKGDMYARFEVLKRKLFAEGLFDQARKKPLPLMPKKVAVVTSESGAAIRDIWNVSARRNPSIPILLIPVTVQGEKAGSEIARGIRTAAEQPGIDVIIVARGGGSAEDLWCFNDEAVARAVAECPVPVVSGVGHEIDTTICDLAADVRAATPSNAAEIVFPDRKELAGRTRAMALVLARAATGAIRDAEKTVRDLRMAFSALSPERRIAELTSGSALRRAALHHAMRIRMEETAGILQMAGRELAHVMDRRIQDAGTAVVRLQEKMQAINPMSVLNRGYALVFAGNGRLITRKREADSEREMKVRFADGEIEVYHDGRKERNAEL